MVRRVALDTNIAIDLLNGPIPENDIWIAATCKVNKISLLTRDQHFSYVPQLRVLNPK